MSSLCDALGRKAVAELSRIVGGRRLFVPTFSTNGRSPPARARLVKLVGARIAEDLITNFAGSYVYVPKTDPKPVHVDRKNVARLSRTMSADQIAQRLGCSVRTVYDKRSTQNPTPEK